MASFTHIRDSIVIDSDLKALIDQTSLPPGSTAYLIARRIVHFPEFVLSLPGVNVVLVADSYDANGGKIIVSGVRGAAGPAGGDGANATQPFRGESGGHGGPGTGGSSGGSVRLICLRMHSAHLIAKGGAGGPGGAGAPAVHSVSALGALTATGNSRAAAENGRSVRVFSDAGWAEPCVAFTDRKAFPAPIRQAPQGHRHARASSESDTCRWAAIRDGVAAVPGRALRSPPAGRRSGVDGQLRVGCEEARVVT